MRNLIQYDSILSEDKIFKTKVDYEKLFEEVSDDIKNNFEELTEYYFNNIYPGIDNVTSIFQTISNIDFEELQIIIKIYISKDYKNFFDLTSTQLKIGCSAWLDCNYNYINFDYPLQNIWIIYDISEGEEIFKDVIYSILFYAYIIKRDFKYNSLLTFLNHEEDIEDLVNVKEIYIKLYGNDKECCVCGEKTQDKTVCNHTICQKCYTKLEKKICPICRKKFKTTENQLQIILN